MHRGSQKDRQRRTLTAPNGARVVFPPGVNESFAQQQYDEILRWYFIPAVAKMAIARTPLLDKLPRRRKDSYGGVELH